VINLGESTLVNQFSDALQVGITPSNVWLADTQHVHGSLVQFNEHSIVNLSQSEELKRLSYLRVDLVNTTNSDDKRQLGLRWNVEVTLVASLATHTNFITLLLSVLLHVLLSTLEDLNSLVTCQTAVLCSVFQLQGLRYYILLPSLENRLGNRRQFLAAGWFSFCLRFLCVRHDDLTS